MGDITSLDTQPMSELVCPECATPASQREVPPPWPVRRRRLVQCAALLIALGYVVWRNIEAWPVLPTPVVSSSIPYTADFPLHRHTRLDIERYASGELSDGRFISDLLNTDLFSNYELGVTFLPPSGVATEFQRYGWPTTIVLYRYDAKYDDAYAKTNASARPSSFRNGWWGWDYISKRIDASGRRESFVFYSRGLAGGPLMLLAAWGAGRLLRRIVFLLRVASRDGLRKRDRLARRAPVLCVVACAIGVTIASLRPQIDPGYAYPSLVNPVWSNTGVTAADVAQLAKEPTGEAVLAQAILDATPGEASTPDTCLAFGWRSEIGTTHTDGAGGWPGPLVHRNVGEQQSFEALGRPEVSLTFRRASVSAIVHWSGPRERTAYYTLSSHSTASLALGLCAVWIATGLGVWLVGWTVRRRTARRLARGWCVQCGYDLKGLTGAAEATTRA
ncbi:MAG: hypothetical protein IID31_06475 [Planctomycetes bacterium]|nr:hypothetical protein [Planctomycetota bacterium]